MFLCERRASAASGRGRTPKREAEGALFFSVGSGTVEGANLEGSRRGAVPQRRRRVSRRHRRRSTGEKRGGGMREWRARCAFPESHGGLVVTRPWLSFSANRGELEPSKPQRQERHRQYLHRRSADEGLEGRAQRLRKRTRSLEGGRGERVCLLALRGRAITLARPRMRAERAR